jgi:6,7-dimethyl-8-ribityllumazine synthase
MTIGQTNPNSCRLAVIVSRYNATITDQLLRGALDVAARRGWTADVWHAPGAFELPTLCDHALATGRYHGAVTLGCIIRGETSHDQHIAQAIAGGVVQVALKRGKPVTLGVLTVNTPEQASARAGGAHGNKGADAMSALIDTLGVISQSHASNGHGPHTFTLCSTINDKASGSV